MLKKTVTYEDFDGNQRTEDLYFNLTKSELMEMQMKTEGGLENTIEKITSENDTAKIIEMFKDIIMSAYGVKSEDGKKFRKRPEDKEDFLDSAAYDALFMELISDADAASSFVSGIIPKDMVGEVQEAMKENSKVVEMKPDPNK